MASIARHAAHLVALPFVATVLAVVAGTAAHAQAIPGLIVSTPEQSGAPSPGQPHGGSAVPSYFTPPGARPQRTAPAPKRPARAESKKRSPSRRRAASPKRASTAIVLLVNDDPITEYEILQRARLMSLRANLREKVQSRFRAMIKQPSTNHKLKAILQRTIEENRGKSRDHILKLFERRKKAFAMSLQKRAIASARASLIPQYRKKAIGELIEERLKLHEAKRLKIAVDNKQLDEAIGSIAKRNKLTPNQFKAQITRMGVDFSTMRERIRAQLSWNNVIRARFSRLISINQREIDEALAGRPNNQDELKLKLHRVTLSLPNNFSQVTLAARIGEAEALQRRFRGCGSTKKLAASVKGARFEDLGLRRAETVPEPTRSLLFNAQDGQMVPPSTTGKGIELYAVCDRKLDKSSLKAQAEVRAKLRQEEFDIMARRHLMDLKRDAHIERRG